MTSTPPQTTNSLPFVPLTPDSIEIERGRASSPDPDSPSPSQQPRRRSRSRLTSLSLRRRPTSVVHISSEPIELTADALLAVETDADKRLAASVPTLPSEKTHLKEDSTAASENGESSNAGMDELKTPTAANGHGIRARVLSLGRRNRPAGVVHMSSEPNLSAQAQAHAIAESLLATRPANGNGESASLHSKTSEPALSAAAAAKPRSRVLSLSLRRRPASMAPTPSAPTAQALAEAMASTQAKPGVPMPTLPMTPPPSEPRTSVEREADMKSVTSVESGALVSQQSPEGSVKKRSRVLSLKRPTSILRRQGSVASVSSGSKSHSGAYSLIGALFCRDTDGVL